jgi:CRISPR system Cascade subunit CasD
MGIRCDQEGISRYDFQTAENVATADGKVGKYPTISQRYYLADAAFTVGLQSTDTPLLKRIEEALRNPVWPLGLGRKSYVPSESIWLRDGLVDKPLKQALVEAPWLRRVDRPEKLRFVFESQSSEGSARMDQPVASFAERKFITRYVVSQYIPMEPALSASGAEKAADIEEADVPL